MALGELHRDLTTKVYSGNSQISVHYLVYLALLVYLFLILY